MITLVRFSVLVTGLLVGGTASRAALYPIITNPDSSTSYSVNVVRQLSMSGALLTSASATYSNDGAQGAGAPPANAIDGDDEPWRFVSTNYSAGDADATGVLTIQFPQIYSINRVRQFFESGTPPRYPNSYGIRVSPDGSSWTQVVPTTSTTGAPNEIISTFGAQPTKFLEITGTGLGSAINQASWWEVGAYIAGTAPAPSTEDRYDLTYMSGVSASISGGLTGAASNVLDKLTTGVNGTSGATSDGLLTIDLGSVHKVFNVGLKFRQNQNWANGGKIEGSLDNSTFFTLFDTGLGPDLFAGNYMVPRSDLRYLRIRNYYSNGSVSGTALGTGTGRLDEVEIFAPEPTAAMTVVLLALTTTLTYRGPRRCGAKN